MTDPKHKPDDYAWERKLAPRISRGRLGAAVGVYVAWLAFLGFLSAQRWFGTLQ